MQHITRIAKQLRRLPPSPGVYFFFDAARRLLYVGKAANLKSRARSYFTGSRDTHNAARAKMISEISGLKWEAVPSEPEALIREAELIKRLKPKYNVLLRDDKNYFFVGVTKEPFPKVSITHQPHQNQKIKTKAKKYKSKNEKAQSLQATSYKLKARFIGPFTDGTALKRTLKLLRKVFHYCTCRAPHKRPCLAAAIGRCAAACCLKDARTRLADYGKIKRRYRQNIWALEETLSGKRQRLRRHLERAMKTAARAHEFERAAALRDQMRALDAVFAHRGVVVARELVEERGAALRELQKLLGLPRAPGRIEMYDISNIQGAWAVGSMIVFENGMPAKSEYRKFRVKTVAGSDDVAMMKEVISRRLAHARPQIQSTKSKIQNGAKGYWPLPDVLAVDGGRGQIGAAAAAIRDSRFMIHDSSFAILGLAKGKDELHYTIFNSISYKLKAVSTVSRSRLPQPLRHLLAHLQDEAHRFAIGYHRRLRSNGP